MAAVAEHGQITRPLAPAPLIGAVVYVQAIGCIADLAAVIRPLQRTPAALAPLSGLQVFLVGHRGQRVLAADPSR
jgi:hypothetical protein